MSGVRLESVTKTFPGGVTAVAGVSLTVAGGEMLALLGPSGCGKTTLLRIVAGLTAPTAGRVSIHGRDVTADPPHRRDVAMVFQDPALLPTRPVFDSISLPLRFRRLPRREIDERVRRIAAELGLSELLTRRPGELSGGQRRRASLARALVREPRVLLFDEPLSQLDAPLRRDTGRLIREVQQARGVPAVYVTHDEKEADGVADRVIYLEPRPTP